LRQLHLLLTCNTKTLRNSYFIPKSRTEKLQSFVTGFDDAVTKHECKANIDKRDNDGYRYIALDGDFVRAAAPKLTPCHLPTQSLSHPKAHTHGYTKASP
jgi:hypothetical protein